MENRKEGGGMKEKKRFTKNGTVQGNDSDIFSMDSFDLVFDHRSYT